MCNEFYRSLLSGKEDVLYSILLQGLQDRTQVIRFPASATITVNRVMGAILHDHPEIVWTNGQWSGEPEKTSVAIPKYTLSEDGIYAFQREATLMAEVLRAVATLPERERVRWIYDFLLENIVYDLQSPHSQDAYGALVEGRAVCRGITKAVQLLLRACGLEATTLDGKLNGEALHTWNVATLAVGSFHLDLTMGYPMFAPLYTGRGLPYSRYAAFCVSDDTLRQTHSWDYASFPIHCLHDLSEASAPKESKPKTILKE